MVLFLESAAPSSRNTVTLTEATLILIETEQVNSQIMSSIFHEDFILHENNDESKKEGFVTRTIEKLKQVLTNILNGIKNFFAAIMNKIRNKKANAEAKTKINQGKEPEHKEQNVTISKFTVDVIEYGMKHFNDITNSAEHALAVLKTREESDVAKINEEIAKIEKIYEDRPGLTRDKITVPHSRLESLHEEANKLISRLQSFTSRFTKSAEAVKETIESQTIYLDRQRSKTVNGRADIEKRERNVKEAKDYLRDLHKLTTFCASYSKLVHFLTGHTLTAYSYTFPSTYYL